MLVVRTFTNQQTSIIRLISSPSSYYEVHFFIKAGHIGAALREYGRAVQHAVLACNAVRPRRVVKETDSDKVGMETEDIMAEETSQAPTLETEENPDAPRCVYVYVCMEVLDIFLCIYTYM